MMLKAKASYSNLSLFVTLHAKCTRQRRVQIIRTTSSSFALRRQKGDQETQITGNIAHGGVGIAAGQIAERKRIFTQSNINTYAELAGDPNPLHQQQSSNHLDNDKEEPTETRSAVVHGMLVASLFSSIFGSIIPGAIYRQQSLHFRYFVHVNEPVVGRIRVVEVRCLRRRGNTRIVRCETEVYHQETQQVCIQGQAEVILTEDLSSLSLSPK